MLLHDSLTNFLCASSASGEIHWLEFSQLLALSLVLTIPLLFGLRWLGAFLRFLTKWMLRIPAISYLLNFLYPYYANVFFLFASSIGIFYLYDGLAIFFETLDFSQSICAATLLVYTGIFRFYVDYRTYLDQILRFKLIFFTGYAIFLIFSCQLTYLLSVFFLSPLEFAPQLCLFLFYFFIPFGWFLKLSVPGVLGFNLAVIPTLIKATSPATLAFTNADLANLALFKSKFGHALNTAESVINFSSLYFADYGAYNKFADDTPQIPRLQRAQFDAMGKKLDCLSKPEIHKFVSAIDANWIFSNFSKVVPKEDGVRVQFLAISSYLVKDAAANSVFSPLDYLAGDKANPITPSLSSPHEFESLKRFSNYCERECGLTVVQAVRPPTGTIDSLVSLSNGTKEYVEHTSILVFEPYNVADFLSSPALQEELTRKITANIGIKADKGQILSDEKKTSVTVTFPVYAGATEDEVRAVELTVRKNIHAWSAVPEHREDPTYGRIAKALAPPEGKRKLLEIVPIPHSISIDDQD